MESRAMAETQMNEQSSRSHAIIVLNLAITMVCLIIYIGNQ
jgi:hypothetical protein